MKKCSACKVEKQRSEFSKHSHHKDGLSAHCKVCSYAAHKEWRIKKRMGIDTSRQASCQIHFLMFDGRGCPECRKKQNARYHQQNKERHELYKKTWRLANKSHYRETENKRRRERTRANPELWAAKDAARHAKKREKRLAQHKAWRLANPQRWKALHSNHNIMRYRLLANQKIAKAYVKETTEIYEKCPEGFHVDHIIPLRGKTVNGLHVPWNLQYLPAKENLKKKNSWWPDMPEPIHV